jgi:hypothetical protein
MESNHILRKLPQEIFDIILSYGCDTIKKRNGQYMNQILITDKRYSMLDRHFTTRKRSIYDTAVTLFLTKCQPYIDIHIIVHDTYVFYHYERKNHKTCSYFLE